MSFLTVFLSVCRLAGYNGAMSINTNPGSRPRARDLGIASGILPPGPLNAVADVAGVRVGHAALWAGDDIRTGDTAILPHAGNLFQEKVPTWLAVGNGYRPLTTDCSP